MINVTNVGHVVLKVRDLERSVRFYRDVLGLKEVARATFDRPMAFFSATGENHHDIGLFEIGPDAASPEKSHVGLYHVALRIGHSLEALRGGKRTSWRTGSKSFACGTTPSANPSTSTTPTETGSNSMSMRIQASGATTLPRWRRRCRSNSEDALKAGDPRAAMH